MLLSPLVLCNTQVQYVDNWTLHLTVSAGPRSGTPLLLSSDGHPPLETDIRSHDQCIEMWPKQYGLCTFLKMLGRMVGSKLFETSRATLRSQRVREK
jgi:hypothetical protein